TAAVRSRGPASRPGDHRIRLCPAVASRTIGSPSVPLALSTPLASAHGRTECPGPCVGSPAAPRHIRMLRKAPLHRPCGTSAYRSYRYLLHMLPAALGRHLPLGPGPFERAPADAAVDDPAGPGQTDLVLRHWDHGGPPSGHSSGF